MAAWDKDRVLTPTRHLWWYHGPYFETRWFSIYIGSAVHYGTHYGWGICFRRFTN